MEGHRENGRKICRNQLKNRNILLFVNRFKLHNTTIFCLSSVNLCDLRASVVKSD